MDTMEGFNTLTICTIVIVIQKQEKINIGIFFADSSTYTKIKKFLQLPKLVWPFPNKVIYFYHLKEQQQEIFWPGGFHGIQFPFLQLLPMLFFSSLFRVLGGGSTQSNLRDQSWAKLLPGSGCRGQVSGVRSLGSGCQGQVAGVRLPGSGCLSQVDGVRLLESGCLGQVAGVRLPESGFRSRAARAEFSEPSFYVCINTSTHLEHAYRYITTRL